MPPASAVSDVRVDDDGIRAASEDEVVLDVVFDGRRIWSFWLHRDGRRSGGSHLVPWPPALRRFLDGTTRLQLVEHVAGTVAYDAEVALGPSAHSPGAPRIAVVNSRGLPLGIDKSLRLAQTFDTRSAEHVAPLLDSIEEVLTALRKAGVEAFPAYGTLLGAVRGGRLIGHDSDADLGYVSEHDHPVDVVRESFRLQRALAEMGYSISRYSGAAFKVDVKEADGSVRGLDVFGGFLREGRLSLMGEIHTPFARDAIFPLGVTTLEGRELPAPADTDAFLTATYGPAWRVPDPAYKFETPVTTHRRLNGWFRGTRVRREAWDRTYSRVSRTTPPAIEPSTFATWVRRSERGVPARIVDIGCGRGVDDLWFARQGASVLGLDYVSRAHAAVARMAAAEDVALEFRAMNLVELRSVLAESARAARLPGRTVVTARHVADATDKVGRRHLWRSCRMILRGGGRLYLELLTARGEGDPFAREQHLRALSLRAVADDIEAYGGRVVRTRQRRADAPGDRRGHRIGRLVVEWQR